MSSGNDAKPQLLDEIAALRRQLTELESRARREGLPWRREAASMRELIDSSESVHFEFAHFTVEHLSDAAYWIQQDSSIVYVNDAAINMLGYSRAELLSMRVYDLDPTLPSGAWPMLWKALELERKRTLETQHRAKDGTLIPVEVLAHYFELEGVAFSCALVRDIRERKEMEARLRQAEKMDAVGQLAGGIAHDFNNQLMGIMGYADLLSREVGDDPNLSDLVQNILVSVTRSAELTAQLLAFSRKGKYLSKPVDLHQIVREVTGILEHSIDKRIVIRTDLGANQSHTVGDTTQLQSAILNLALNARDAMPEGGVLTFASENVDLDAGFQPDHGFPLTPGCYVKLSVIDTGTGMSPDVQSRMFEPFFTTKTKGKGTGLGLAAVYGTVKNHRGAIKSHSQISVGSKLELFLPISSADASGFDTSAPEQMGSQRGAHIMVVEDEPQLRDVARRMLESLGYRVTTFESGGQAVEYFRERHAKVDPVVLDMVMPVMSGRETFRLLRDIDPTVRAVLASGYSLDGDAQAILDDGVIGVIQKPYGRKMLDDLLRMALTAESLRVSRIRPHWSPGSD